MHIIGSTFERSYAVSERRRTQHRRATLALPGALRAGYHMAGSKTRSWLHSVGFAAVLSATTYVILDIEYPRLGFIRVDAADEVLLDLRRQMN